MCIRSDDGLDQFQYTVRPALHCQSRQMTLLILYAIECSDSLFVLLTATSSTTDDDKTKIVRNTRWVQ